MPFKISEISGTPVWDTLPVAKITNYPFEKGAFKPFAQVRACVSENGLHLRMWAFETKKRPNSYILAALNLSEKSDRTLLIAIYADSTVKMAIKDNDDYIPLNDKPEAVFFDGEDLEGIYWGACVTVDNKMIKEYFDSAKLKAGYSFKGNFFKVCSDPEFDHAGCFSYVEVPSSVGLFDKRRFDDFTIVEY